MYAQFQSNAKRFEELARQYGRYTDIMQLNKTLYVNGVGEGAAVCYSAGRCPIACRYQYDDARTVQQDSYVANIATGSGEHLPAILGLGSMQQDLRVTTSRTPTF